VEIGIFPRWLLLGLGIPVERARETNLFLSAIAALAFTPLLVLIPHVCLVRSLLHIPCPGCGVMHSIIAVEHLEFARAWQFNPGGIALSLLLIFQVLARPVAIFVEKTRPAVNRISRQGAIAVLVCLAAAWLLRLLQGDLHSGIHFLS
jgi:hypothetical protein